MLRPLLGAAVAALALAFTSVPAAASLDVCEVFPTPDGFVALRAGPSVRSAIVARMRPGHGVLIHRRHSGRWLAATYWPDGQVPGERDARRAEGRRGWVHLSLIGCDI